MSVHAEHKKRVAEGLAKKQAERAATAAVEIPKLSEAPKPVETMEFQVKSPKGPAPRYGRSTVLKERSRAAARFTTRVAAKARPVATKVQPVVEATKAVKPVQAAMITKKISETLRRLPSRGPAGLVGKAASGAAAKVPLLRALAKPMGAIGKNILRPASTAVDVGVTALAGYTGVKAVKEIKSLSQRAEKLKVPMKRRGLPGVIFEALTEENADMDPGVKVWNPKTKRWD